MHFVTEELARLRRRELLEEACEQRLVAKAERASLLAAVRLRRSAARRG